MGKKISPDHELEAEVEDAAGETAVVMRAKTPKRKGDINADFETAVMPAMKRPPVKKPSTANYLVDNPPFIEPSALDLCQAKDNLNPDDWNSEELGALYMFLKLYGTGDDALEYIAASGIERTYEEIVLKINEIRSLNSDMRAERLDAYMEHCARIGESCANEIELAKKMPVGDLIGVKWSSAILTATSGYRLMNTLPVRDAIAEALNQIPSTKYDNVTSNISVSTRRHREKMDIDYGKIKEFLQNTALGKTKGPNLTGLNSLESAVVLNIMDEIKEEARTKLTLAEKAQVRGMLRNVKRNNYKDFAMDYPCNEFNATQLYLDPLRTRDISLPSGGKKLTEADVDARRPNLPLDDMDGGNIDLDGSMNEEPMPMDNHNNMRLLVKNERLGNLMDQGHNQIMEQDDDMQEHAMDRHDANMEDGDEMGSDLEYGDVPKTENAELFIQTYQEAPLMPLQEHADFSGRAPSASADDQQPSPMPTEQPDGTLLLEL